MLEGTQALQYFGSHPARGAWIEIHTSEPLRSRISSRTPQRVRGLKCIMNSMDLSEFARRTPQGVRGLKFCSRRVQLKIVGRTPQGVRGLKLMDDLQITISLTVAPRKGCVD